MKPLTGLHDEIITKEPRVATAEETVVISGHIIDSLILSKVLDTIIMMGGTLDLHEVSIGKTRQEPSRARILVQASSENLLFDILRAIEPHGASVERQLGCQWKEAPAPAGASPDDLGHAPIVLLSLKT
jgi:hypothetical protein